METKYQEMENAQYNSIAHIKILDGERIAWLFTGRESSFVTVIP